MAAVAWWAPAQAHLVRHYPDGGLRLRSSLPASRDQFAIAYPER